MEILKTLLENVYRNDAVPPSVEAIDAMVSLAEVRNVEGKQLMIEAGSIFNEIWYVREGMVRAFVMEKSKDYTVSFFTEGQFIWDWHGYDKGLPSRFSYETLFPTTLECWDKASFDNCMATYPSLLKGRRLDTEAVYLRAVSRLISLQADSLKERYLKLLEMHGELINKVPQYHLASFLGVKPQSLSRIKTALLASKKS